MDLGCGISFDIFTHVSYTGLFKIYYNIYTQRNEKKVHFDDLEDGYNVVKLQRKNKRERHIETGTVYNKIITLHPVEKDNF